MRYSILAFAAGAAAAPFAATGGAALCPTGLFSNPQCCATDVLGAVGLNCAVPSTTPANTSDFISICAATGQQAKCCVIPVADQDVLCQDVSPGAGGSPAPAPAPTATVTATGGAPAPTGGASSSSCDSSSAAVTTATPTKPAPTPSAPATTSDCGCDD